MRRYYKVQDKDVCKTLWQKEDSDSRDTLPQERPAHCTVDWTPEGGGAGKKEKIQRRLGMQRSKRIYNYVGQLVWSRSNNSRMYKVAIYCCQLSCKWSVVSFRHFSYVITVYYTCWFVAEVLSVYRRSRTTLVIYYSFIMYLYSIYSLMPVQHQVPLQFTHHPNVM